MSAMSPLLRYKHLRPLRISKDNSFYKAIAIALYKDENLYLFVRKVVTDSMLETVGSTGFIRNSLQKNQLFGVWTPELSIIIPHAITQILPICIEIYTGDINNPLRKYGKSVHEKIRLLETNGHFDLLVKK